MLTEPNYSEKISQKLWMKNFQVRIILEMIDEWATVPFIARYRKEKTENLDENNIRDIIEFRTKEKKLFKLKKTAITTIEEMEKMTPELMEKIIKLENIKDVEELYKPYKSKRKTKAMIAIENGFQPIADELKRNSSPYISKELLKNFSEKEILSWAIDIVSAEISTDIFLREKLTNYISTKWKIISKIKWKTALEKLNEKTKNEIKKFDLYNDFDLQFWKIKPYQILALNRWEKLWILNVKLEKTEECYEYIKSKYSQNNNISWKYIDLLEEAFKWGYTSFFKSIENQARNFLSEDGEDDAISSFQSNLWALLRTKPEYGKRVLALDPWYRAGCKLTILDEFWNPILFEKIYLHSIETAKKILQNIFLQHKIDTIVIGNGTASNETVELLSSLTDKEIFIINESWASVYSASKIAAEEFPNLDSLDRGTVSIGRRFIDPLSELVKIPVESIGVWMYQHDMPIKKLEEKLGYVVEDVVNEVWININTASIYVLNHISGITKTVAKKLYKNRPYSSRKEIKKQLSSKIYEQCIGFLRVPNSKQVFDNTNIHPEQYKLAEYIIKNNISVSNFENYSTILKEIYPDVKSSTIEFIKKSYSNIGKDPRIHSAHQKAWKKINIDELKEWDILLWVIRNVVAFWAFVDIWVKNDGLVHVSQIANTFVSNPADFVQIGEEVKVKITSIDRDTGKIWLSIKDV